MLPGLRFLEVGKPKKRKSNYSNKTMGGVYRQCLGFFLTYFMFSHARVDLCFISMFTYFQWFRKVFLKEWL